MFATLLGGLPRPSAMADDDAAVDVVIGAQVEAGFEPITDGRLRDPGFEGLARALGSDGEAGARVVDQWRFVAERTDRAVKQALPGPMALAGLASGSRGRPAERTQLMMGSVRGREPDAARRTLELAAGLRAHVEALAAAGCPLVEIEEPAAALDADEGVRRAFWAAHRRLAEGVTGTHLSLSIVGGAVPHEAIPVVVDLPYASLAVDLIAGPDNWNLLRRWPGDRGVVAGVLASPPRDQPREVLLWAAHYAASGGRGLDRVGLGSAGSWANLTWESAMRHLQKLGEAARIAAMPRSEEQAGSLDPRAVSTRRAALGHAGARASQRRRPRR